MTPEQEKQKAEAEKMFAALAGGLSNLAPGGAQVLEVKKTEDSAPPPAQEEKPAEEPAPAPAAEEGGEGDPEGEDSADDEVGLGEAAEGAGETIEDGLEDGDILMEGVLRKRGDVTKCERKIRPCPLQAASH